MEQIIYEIYRAIKDGQMHIDDVPEIYQTAVAELCNAENTQPETAENEV